MEFLQLLLGGLANGCIYGLIALGFVLIYKATEMVNFAQGDLMMLGAYMVITFVNAQWMGFPFLFGLIAAMFTLGLFSFLIDKWLLRRIFGQPPFAIIILTIALGFIFRFIAGAFWGHDPVVLEHPFAGQSFSIPMGEDQSLVVSADEFLAIVVTLILTTFLYLFFGRTRLGVAMQACSQNQLAAYYMGIPVRRIYSLVWALAGVLATVAGALFAMKGSIDPSSGFLGIKAFAAAVIGGFGSLPGALLGGIIVGVTEPLAARYIATGFSQIAPYAIMLLVLILAPNGLFAQMQHKKV